MKDSSLEPSSGAPTIIDRALSNQDFLQRHARPGCVGLSCGPTLADRVILAAERHLDEEGRPGRWSHAFFFQGLRADGHHLFRKLQLDLAPGLEVKHATPEDLSRTHVPHRTFLRLRPEPASRVAELGRKLHRLRARLRGRQRKDPA